MALVGSLLALSGIVLLEVSAAHASPALVGSEAV
jgi:hypothetical protein